MNSVPRAFRPKVAVEVLFGDLAERRGLAHAGAGVEDVDPALLPLHRLEQPIEVVEIGHVALHAGDVAADQLDRLVERLLPAAR